MHDLELVGFIEHMAHNLQIHQHIRKKKSQQTSNLFLSKSVFPKMECIY